MPWGLGIPGAIPADKAAALSLSRRVVQGAEGQLWGGGQGTPQPETDQEGTPSWEQVPAQTPSGVHGHRRAAPVATVNAAPQASWPPGPHLRLCPLHSTWPLSPAHGAPSPQQLAEKRVLVIGISHESVSSLEKHILLQHRTGVTHHTLLTFISKRPPATGHSKSVGFCPVCQGQ